MRIKGTIPKACVWPRWVVHIILWVKAHWAPARHWALITRRDKSQTQIFVTQWDSDICHTAWKPICFHYLSRLPISAQPLCRQIQKDRASMNMWTLWVEFGLEQWSRYEQKAIKDALMLSLICKIESTNRKVLSKKLSISGVVGVPNLYRLRRRQIWQSLNFLKIPF